MRINATARIALPFEFPPCIRRTRIAIACLRFASTGELALSRLSLARALCAFALLATLHAFAEPALNVQTSWIGNTFGFGDGAWTQINITALAVSPDGKVYTNAPWD